MIEVRTAINRVSKLLKLSGQKIVSNKNKYIVRQFCEFYKIPYSGGKNTYIAFLIEQYNNPESLIYKEKKLPPDLNQQFLEL